MLAILTKNIANAAPQFGYNQGYGNYGNYGGYGGGYGGRGYGYGHGYGHHHHHHRGGYYGWKSEILTKTDQNYSVWYFFFLVFE